MILSIDRFEGDYAVCIDDNGKKTDLPRALLPTGSREGDCIRPDSQGNYHLDPEETHRRRQRAIALSQKLFRHPNQKEDVK